VLIVAGLLCAMLVAYGLVYHVRCEERSLVTRTNQTTRLRKYHAKWERTFFWPAAKAEEKLTGSTVILWSRLDGIDAGY
jgi:hypothetical protein